MKNIILSISLFSLILISCEKSYKNTINITITPTEGHLIRTSGDVIIYNIKITSPESLSKFRISETIDHNTPINLLEKSITGDNHTESYSYIVPNISTDSANITIKFSVETSSGDTKDRAKTVLALATNSLLEEYAGNTMFSCSDTLTSTNLFNAYNLLTVAPTNNADSTAHIADLCDSTGAGQFLRTWYSPSGIKFVRYNSFDYANATESMIEDAYNTGLKVEVLYDINQNDIMLTKIGNKFCAIKLIYVIDEVGVQNDRYEFSIKK